MDVMRLFRPLSEGQRHNLNRAFRNLLNFLECMGWPKAYLNLRKRADQYYPRYGRYMERLKAKALTA